MRTLFDFYFDKEFCLFADSDFGNPDQVSVYRNNFSQLTQPLESKILVCFTILDDLQWLKFQVDSDIRPGQNPNVSSFSSLFSSLCLSKFSLSHAHFDLRILQFVQDSVANCNLKHFFSNSEEFKLPLSFYHPIILCNSICHRC